MKKLLSILFLSITALAQSQVLMMRPSFPHIDFVGKTAVFIGNSITAGASASDNAHRWASLFSTAKGCTESNLGIGGQVLQNVATLTGRTIFDETTIPTYSSSYCLLFISLGTNDIGLNNGSFTPTAFESTLEDVIDYAVGTKGWPASSIVIICPPYMTSAGYANYVGADGVTVAADVARHEAYVEAVVRAAYIKGCRSINVYAEMKNSISPSDLISGVDGIHPNDSGHAFIANYLINNIF